MMNRSRRFHVAHGWEKSALLVAALSVGLWLWMCWCIFPGRTWNDVRLAPIFGLKLGLPLYGGVEGLASTWMYGPLPVLLLWPATWTQSAAAALVTAGTLNLLVLVLTIGAVCAAWPHGDQARAPSAGARFAAAMLALVLWPGAAWQYLQADNFAIAFGLLANLALIVAPSPVTRWGAALLATAGLFCKQTALGVPLAQLIWLASSIGWRAMGLHLVRLCLAGSVWLGVFLLGQDSTDAWFNLVRVPGALPWTDQPWQRLADLAPHLTIHLLLPLAVWAWLRRSEYRRALELPMATWACSLPFGLAGLMKIGGSLNNLQGFPLWLPPALVVVMQAAETRCPRWRPHLAAGLLVVGIACWRILLLPAPVLTPAVELVQQGEQLARTSPGRIWFPWNPLMTVYGEQRLYHVEDGLFVRHLVGQPVTPESLRRGLPQRMTFVALPQRSTDWGLALSLLPANAPVHNVGYWRLHSTLPRDAAR